jgi:WD40 repeat protein
LDSGGELRTLVGHHSSVNGVAVTPDGCYAVSASSDSTLKVWDLDSGCELRNIPGHTFNVNWVALTPDGRRAASASSDRTLKVWDIATGDCVATFICDAPVGLCSFAENDRIVASDKTLRVYILSLVENPLESQRTPIPNYPSVGTL